MNKALKDFDHEWKTGDRNKAKKLAQEYVDANADELTAKYAQFGIPELVPMVDAARDAKDEATVVEIDMWLLTKHPQQHVTGKMAK
jgi:hypothetical protein